MMQSYYFLNNLEKLLRHYHIINYQKFHQPNERYEIINKKYFKYTYNEKTYYEMNSSVIYRIDTPDLLISSLIDQELKTVGHSEDLLITLINDNKILIRAQLVFQILKLKEPIV